MDGTFLNRILETKRLRVRAAEEQTSLSEIRRIAVEARADAQQFRLTAALSRSDRHNIIAEIKKASPSLGPICLDGDVTEIAKSYESGGAAAISILTEEDYFRGSLDDLKAVRSVCSLPLLRKDFVVSAFQIYEAAANGADAVLLIVAALEPAEFQAMLTIAHEELHLDAIVEVHTQAELSIAHDAGATVVGINNRDLKSFETSLDVSRRLIADRRPGTLYISESGIDSPEQVSDLRVLGFSGFLIGEKLMRSGADRESAVRAFAAAPARRAG